ncbi:uncharacterized protein YFR016C-like [Colias croceus]|uniref:uncharacterized protein YFR016C-like n=1 Tax=Colias crocea TaxID=72248 RepID=UPI001E27B60F|nr:uncharacterized protein YFR016C-like [Colias croceus]
MRGRGSYRGSSQRGHGRENNPQGGPLMTNHLRELDIELEILKRKRDMIQQEHELLNRERQFNLKRQYQQEPSSSYSQNSYRQDYDDSSNYYRPQGTKRQAVAPQPLRRYEPPQRVEPWAQNSAPPKPKNYQNPKPALQPQPLLSLYMDPQKLNFKPSKPNIPNRQNSKPPPKSLPPRKDFNPTKVTKPKLRTTYIQKPQTEAPAKKLLVDDDLILQPNVKASPQMNGRLELALGSIMKDIKQFEPSGTNPSLTFFVLKMIKKIIRGRIRGVMTGKVVGNVQDIVDTYRKKYPKDTDTELFELGKQAHDYNLASLGEKSNFESEEPKKYFRMNITKLLSKKLEEIFNHAKDMYANKNNPAVIKKLMDNVVDITEKNEDDPNATAPVATEKDNLVVEEIEKNIAKAESYAKLMEALIEEKLPKLLPRFKSNMLTVLDVDKEYYDSKAKIEEETIKLAVKLMSNKIDLTKADNKNKKIDTVVICDSPKVIDLCQEEETKINDAENTEKSVDKATPVDQNTEKVAADKSAQQITKSSASPVPTTPSKIIDYPYFVKLIGRPELPSRQAVYDFLEQFKPASIKKHKTVSNLLVLGFNEKEGFDKILEASGKTIGTNTLIAKASEKVATTPLNTPVRNETNQNVDKVEKTNKTEPDQSKDTSINTSGTSLLSSDLDEQITNLLTTIRQTADELNTSDNSKKDTESIDTEEKEKDNSCDAAMLDAPDVPASNDKAVPMEPIAEEEEKTEDKEDENKTIEEKNTPDESEEQEQKKVAPNDNNDAKTDETSKDDASSDNGKNGDTVKEEISEDKDPKNSLKNSGTATPTRASARLATVTPSSIKTRRASRLALNNP